MAGGLAVDGDDVDEVAGVVQHAQLPEDELLLHAVMQDHLHGQVQGLVTGRKQGESQKKEK